MERKLMTYYENKEKGEKLKIRDNLANYIRRMN